MKCPFCFCFALGLATLQTCQPAHAGPVEDYAAKRFSEGVLDAHRVRHELAQPVAILSTNATPARVRSAAEKQIIADAIPLVTTRAAWKAAPNKDAHLDAAIRAKLDAGATLAETRKIIAILTARAAILREGRQVAGDDADEPQPDTVTVSQGQPLYKVLGASELPPVDAIAGAMK